MREGKILDMNLGGENGGNVGDSPLVPEVGACYDADAVIDIQGEGKNGETDLFAVPVGNLPGVIPIDKLAMAVQTMIAPVFEQFGAILERTNQAIERIAASNQVMNARITDLEKQVRLQKPVSRSQEKYINDAIRKRARELLDAKGYAEDRKAVTKLGGAIRKSILSRYGVSSLREAPAYDYETALEQVARWNDLLILKEVTKEARIRKEGANHDG